MKSRETFVKGEIELIKKILGFIFEYIPYSSTLDDEERLMKIIKLLSEIKEETDFKKFDKRFLLTKKLI